MGDAAFSVDVAHIDGATVLRFEGELDLAYAQQAENRALEAFGSTDGGRLVIDLSGLSYCDSSGIRALLNVENWAAKRDLRVVLRHPRPIVRRVLEIMGVDERLTIDGDGAHPPAA
jgi:anti-sigma B factor antagonist